MDAAGRPQSRPPPLPKRKGKIVRWLAIVVTGVALALWIGWCFNNTSHVRRLEAQIRTRGEPLTLAELARTYPGIPASENAAIPLFAVWEKEDPSYWRAIRLGHRPATPQKRKTFDPNLPFLGRNARSFSRTALSSSNRLAAERYLQEQSEHMNAVRSAIQLPRARFPINIQDGYAALLPHLGQIRTETEKFQIEAVVLSEKGRPREALERIRSTKLLADVLAEEPLMVGQLVRLRCLNGALDALEHLMSRQSLSVGELDSTLTLLGEMHLTNALRRSFLGERAVALSVFEMSSSQISQLISERHESEDEIRERAKGTRAMDWLFSITGVKTADRRLILETMTDAVALAEPHTLEAVADYEALEKRLEAESQMFPPKLFSMMLLPAVGKVATRFASFESRRRAAMTACLVEKYRRSQSGKLPGSVTDVASNQAGAFSIDAFDGKSLRSRPRGTGFVVYSIGPDRTDNNGQEPQRSKTHGYDVTFVVER